MPENHAQSRQPNGQWKPGQSGNPNGRPAALSTRLRKRLEDDADAVADVVLDAAKGGDLVAARLVLERCCPALRPVSQPVAVDLQPTENLAETARAVLGACTSGQLDVESGCRLLSALGDVARVIEVEQLAGELAELRKLLEAR